MKENVPPKLFHRFFRWYCHPKLLKYIEGDLLELYEERLRISGKKKADMKFILDVLFLFRPGIIRPVEGHQNLNTYGMYKSYFRIGMRNIIKYRVFSFINVAGLSMGMAVAILIGLWIWDEISFNKSYENYDRIASVAQHLTYNGEIGTQENLPFPVGNELKSKYGSDFRYVVQSTSGSKHILSFEGKHLARDGYFMDVDAPEMLSLKMISGNRSGLNDPSSILLSESTAKAFFNMSDPTGKIMKIDSRLDVTVTGVYEDIPANANFHDLMFISPWQLYVSSENLERLTKNWNWNGWFTYVQLAEHADLNNISNKIRKLSPNKEDKYRPVFFLHAMSQWHLYSEFENGINIGGGIEFVWLFGTIGVFVLLLACINFMNLSTARSEKRAKEVGIRKAIGSLREQLIGQFFTESLLIAAFAFVFALFLVQLVLPFFNDIAGKQVSIVWSSPVFWLLGIGFSLVTGVIAGSYPALYLSSFKPLRALKGSFRTGRMASVPRKVLVVVQFSVSVILIVGTMVVFRQIQYAKNRPPGFNSEGVIMMEMTNDQIHRHASAIRSELKATGAVIEMAEASAPVTDVWSTNGNIIWEGKDPQLAISFPNTKVSQEYGRTVGWEFIEGRDFSSELATDSLAFVITKSAAEFMGLKNPIGTTLKWGDASFHVIGVINDMIQSPYDALRPSVFHLGQAGTFSIVKMNTEIATVDALKKVETVFRKYDTDAPFEFQFVDQEYEKKFGNEVRIGKLATFFATLAILISCLGIFGLASFVAEQRTKEIGIRKVLGASVLSLWQMLSKEFIFLVIASFVVAVPISYYFLHDWLQRFEYRTDLTWWIFGITGVGLLFITLLTVSFQSIKAAMNNPVNSLKSE